VWDLSEPALEREDEMSEMDSVDEAVEEISIEAPEADAVEQHQQLNSAQENRWPERIPFEADPADAADQERTVNLEDEDEDDYR
jgi:hypothetical protein